MLQLLLLIGLSALTTVALNMIVPGLVDTAAEFGVPYATLTPAVSAYLLWTALVQIVVGPLSDRIGRRPVVLAALLVFAAASIGAALADTAEAFLLYRNLQAAVVACFAMTLAMVRDTTDPARAPAVLATISAAMALAPMLGPALGGFITEGFGWRAVLWIYAGMGLAGLLWCLTSLRETRVAAPDPVTGGLWGNGRFWALALSSAFATATFYVFLTLGPFVALEVFGWSRGDTGLLIGSISVGFIAGSTLSARFGAGRSLFVFLHAGRTIGFAGTAGAAALALITGPSVVTFCVAVLCVGFGNGLSIPSANAGALNVPRPLAGQAAGLLGAATVMIGAATTYAAPALLPDSRFVAATMALMAATIALSFLCAEIVRRR